MGDQWMAMVVAGPSWPEGWGGLGAHAIVFGETPAETALVTTCNYRLRKALFLFLSSIDRKLLVPFSFRATDKGASIVASASSKLTIDKPKLFRSWPDPKVG